RRIYHRLCRSEKDSSSAQVPPQPLWPVRLIQEAFPPATRRPGAGHPAVCRGELFYFSLGRTPRRSRNDFRSFQAKLGPKTHIGAPGIQESSCTPLGNRSSTASRKT